MAQTPAHLASSLLCPKLLTSAVASLIFHNPSPPSLLLCRRSIFPLSHAVTSIKAATPSRFTSIRCRVSRSGNSAYSPLKSGSNFSDRPPHAMAPLFPGCDYEHWLIVMDKPGEEGATKQQMIDCYIQTLAKVVGSEEEAKKKIYNVSCERYFGFGCEIDKETSNKLEGLPGVLFVLPDSYVDRKKDNDDVLSPVSDRKIYKLKQKNFEDMAVIGLDSMQQANSSLEDFCRTYFMFHGMDTSSPQSIFKYLPLLSFIESYIYQMDNLNEKMVNLQKKPVAALERGYEEGNENWTAEFVDVLRTDPFRPLVGELERHGLLSERIMEEFRNGAEYWALERLLCYALMNQKEISVEDVIRAVHLKGTDYRILNLLLYQLRGVKVNDLHMEFLSISEFLMEVTDDLFDYENDILENNFNILRMFVRIYGPSTAPVMLAKYIAEAEKKYDSLLKNLDPQLSSAYQRRRVEITKEEGGKVSGHPFGTGSIPPVIEDEELYRSNHLNSN